MYFKPSYLPYNDAAKDSVKTLAEDLGLPSDIKHEIVLASFLATAKAAQGHPFNWLTGNDGKSLSLYSAFPNVGRIILLQIRELLIQRGYLEDTTAVKRQRNEQQALERFNVSWAELMDKMGLSSGYIKPVSQVTAIKGRLPSTLHEATFIQVNLPRVLVNQKETWQSKRLRKGYGLSSPKLKDTLVKQKFRKQLYKVDKPVVEMTKFWQQHPLFNPQTGEYYAAATRIFHNESVTSGGRWYGAWTNYSGEERLGFTIDGDAVCEVDINASLPTLLSCLVSEEMEIGDTWTDVYQSLVEELPDIVDARDKVKQVFVELIGTGNPYKVEPSVNAEGNSLDSYEFILIRNAALQMYPCLKQLNKKRMNFVNALSFHEAEILTQTLLQLKDSGVAAYPIHDCVLVKEEHQTLAVETLRSVYTGYIYSYQKRNNLPYLNIELAVSIESKTSPKERLQGRYLELEQS